MAHTARKAYSDQIPKFAPLNIHSIINFIAAAVTILVFLFGFLTTDYFSTIATDTKTIIFMTYMFLLCVFLLTFIYIRERKKIYTYALIIPHLHLISHIIRDYTASLEDQNDISFKSCLQDIINCTAECFSLLAGRRCHVCIKDLNDNSTITTAIRDTISDKNASRRREKTPKSESVTHSLDDNSDFLSLWYRHNPRYFLSNNLINDYMAGRIEGSEYRNSSFKIHGTPKYKSIAGRMWITRWTLPYRSTIVLPIRYIRDHSKCPSEADHHASCKETQKKCDFVLSGFLCIDCNSRNIFDERFAPEVGACIADMLFSFFTIAKSYGAEKNEKAQTNSAEGFKEIAETITTKTNS